MITDAARLADALEATWPAASCDDLSAPGWRLRRGEGGGKRVSAASALTLGDVPDIEAAEAAMTAIGQDRLFMLRPGEDALDHALSARGYHLIDPVVIYVGDPAVLVDLKAPKGVHWVEARAPLALLNTIWDHGGIGPGRRAVMARCKGPSAMLMARTDAATAGVAFVGVDGDVAMIHAVEVRPQLRREGAGRALLAGAAQIALDNGATTLALAVTEANEGARALYEGARMTEATRYHYRLKPA
ncbi:MAG: GNAT superfamily N-acetyltransferase [Paracoccaceae bacterium]|jgi:GNAT superfamily N-acetyltransferase